MQARLILIDLVEEYKLLTVIMDTDESLVMEGTKDFFSVNVLFDLSHHRDLFLLIFYVGVYDDLSHRQTTEIGCI